MRGSKMNSNTGSMKKTVVLLLIMMAIFVGSACLIPILRESKETVSALYYVFAVALAVLAAVYALLFERRISNGILFWLLPLTCLISMALLLLVEHPIVLPFWCFGGILLLSAYKIRYAVLMNFYFLFLIGSTGNQVSKEALVMQVLCLLLLGFVMPRVKEWMDAVNVLVSVIAVLVSVRIVFFFALKQEILNADIFGIALVYVIVVLAATLFSRMLQANAGQAEDKFDNFNFLEELAASTEVQDAELLQEMEAEQSVEEKFAKVLETDWAEVEAAAGAKSETEDLVTYTKTPAEGVVATEVVTATSNTEESNALLTDALNVLCDEKAELLDKLFKEHPTAFLHARRVALIASEIAERLDGVNALLVKTGGYYHEIGRVLGKNTLENTLLAAEAEDFPTPLISVLREHTVNGDKPTTKEAAILFLTDNICSMCEYLKKSQGGRVLIEKVIDKALNLRITKGDLNASGLSIKEFSVIRNTMAEIIKEDMF